jgi:hypothetical protein
MLNAPDELATTVYCGDLTSTVGQQLVYVGTAQELFRFTDGNEGQPALSGVACS